jgi:hypothetical protein
MFLLSKTAKLKVESSAQQLLGSVPLDIALPALAYFASASVTKKKVL